MSNAIRPLTLLCVALSLGCTGCAYSSYATWSFVKTQPMARVASASGPAPAVKAYFVDNFAAAVARQYDHGMQLVGYASFLSPLKPEFAAWNARMTAKKEGASVVVMAQPRSAILKQSRYLMTFWRKADPKSFLFGAYYEDSPPSLLAMAGCNHDLVSIKAVVPGTPAAAMGLEAGDVISIIDGRRVLFARQVDDELKRRAGKKVVIRYLRGSQLRYAIGRLGEALPDTEGVSKTRTGAGLEIIDGKLSGALAARLGQKQGVFVEGVVYGLPGCFAGLRTADLLLDIGGTKITSPESAVAAVRKDSGKVVPVTVLRVGHPRRFAIDLSAAGLKRQQRLSRRSIAEAGYDAQPWRHAKAENFTWLAATVLAAQIGSEAYTSYVQAENQARIEAYNEAQERARLARESNVVSESDGTYYARDIDGRVVPINQATAKLLKENPGYWVISNSRGVGLQIFDREGSRIPTPSTRRPSYPLTVGYLVLPPVNEGEQIRSLMEGVDLNDSIPNQDVSLVSDPSIEGPPVDASVVPPPNGQNWSGEVY